MSLNKVILIGNVGKDPELRYFDSNSAVANFSLATTERGYRLANGTEVPERTEWHNIVAHRDLAAFAEKWVKKGSLLYVEGKLRYRSYVDRNDVQRYITEVIADKISFFNLGSRRGDEQAIPQPQVLPSVDNDPKPQQNEPAQSAEHPQDQLSGDLPF